MVVIIIIEHKKIYIILFLSECPICQNKMEEQAERPKQKRQYKEKYKYIH